MATILSTKSIYFNDVVLLPDIGKVESRKDIPKELYRVIVSPMVAVIGETFTKEAAKNGLSLCIPRFISEQKKIKLWEIFQDNKTDENQECFVGIGLRDNLSSIASKIRLDSVLVDIAFGNIPQLRKSLIKINGDTLETIENLMVGNVITLNGFHHLMNDIFSAVGRYTGNFYIRVGIGNGGGCSTYDKTKINRGQITELIEISNSKIFETNGNINLVSDGGIYKPGYAVAAFAAGAHYVLMGGYFANAVEAETNVSGDNTFWGCASAKQNKLSNLNKPDEGKERKLNKEDLRDLKFLCGELWDGISSAVSYTGHTKLSNLIGKGVFEIKQNSLPPKKRY